MALRKCKECGKEISTQAKVCPSCGAPVKPQASAAAGCAGLIGLGIVVAICAGILSTSNTREPVKPSQDSSAPMTPPPPPEAPKLPTITVNGDDNHSLNFQGWKMDGHELKAVMTWNGQRAIDSIRYKVSAGGVVKEENRVDIPGGSFRKGEPTEVTVYIHDLILGGDPRQFSVVITVQY